MDRIEEIFCVVDDFCKEFKLEDHYHQKQIDNGIRRRNRSGKMHLSEMLTILLLFQSSHYRNFKHFYYGAILGSLQSAFPTAISYTRFVTLIPRLLLPLCLFLKNLYVSSDGIAYIDSTPIAVCHPKRISRHKVFSGLAEIGKTTKGWFFGFKLHLIINHRGEVCSCQLSTGNINDREPVIELTEFLQGKLFGDKGYIDQKLCAQLLERGIYLVTGIKKNMKNKLLSLWDKILLRKRGLIESANNLLKTTFHLEHSPHRSPWNGFVHMLSAITAYALHPNKPTLKLSEQDLKDLLQMA